MTEPTVKNKESDKSSGNPGRAAAGTAAAVLPQPAALPLDQTKICTLLEHLDEKSPAGRAATKEFEALTRDRRSETVTALAQIVASPERESFLRMNAFNSLRELNPAKAVEAAEKAVENPKTREHGGYMLLFMAVDKDDNLAFRAISALGSLKRDSNANELLGNYIQNESMPLKRREFARQEMLKNRLPSSEDDMRQMAASFPVLALCQYKAFADKPYAEDIVNIALREDPLAAYKSYSAHKSVDLLIASEKSYYSSGRSSGPDGAKSANIISGVVGILSPADKERMYKAFEKQIAETSLLMAAPGADNLDNSKLFGDPLLKGTFTIADTLKELNPAASAKTRIEQGMILSRNITLAGKSPDQETIQSGLADLTDAQSRFSSIELFKGRTVIFAAHGEMVRETKKKNGEPYSEKEYADFEAQSGDSHRFGKKAAAEEVECQAKLTPGGSFQFFRPAGNSPAELNSTKAKILAAIEEAPPTKGLTFLFDGHGGPNGIYLSQGELVEVNGKPTIRANGAAEKITAEELANAFEKRAKRHPELWNRAAESSDVMAFSACFSEDFARELTKKLSGRAPVPILASCTEYGQFGFSEMSSPYGNQFFESGIGLKRENRSSDSSTVGDLIRNGNNLNSNPAIFVPVSSDTPVKLRGKEQKIMQIGQIVRGSESIG